MELQSRHGESPPIQDGHDRPGEPAHQVESSKHHPATQSYLKLIAAGFSFFYAGSNDGTIGPSLPYILQHYHLSTSLVTTMYLASSALCHVTNSLIE
jgi:hypothetical protein